tara:strand:- start:98 stop:505 length:408 start_codon:yes stop_codon:yes gene_type:complete
MIIFVISKNDITKNFECSLKDSILSLKEKIINEFDLKCKYIDIDFQLERPIRSLGKFNLESGIIPRTLDNYPFDRYGLDGKTVNATFNEVNDYQHLQKNTRKLVHVNYSEKQKERIEKQDLQFDIHSESDFPSLN